MGTNETVRKPTILVVDDTPDNIVLLSSLLRDTYRVKATIDGEKALAILASGEPPDIVLLDIMMPGMDGFEVCRRLKADTKTSGIPAIFLTAKSDIEDERKGLELGAVDFITRPIKPHNVKARLITHLQLSAAREFLRNGSVARELQAVTMPRDNSPARIDPELLEALLALADRLR